LKKIKREARIYYSVENDRQNIKEAVLTAAKESLDANQ
jgi:hypothetical protein